MDNIYPTKDIKTINFRKTILCNTELGLILTKTNKRYVVRSLDESESLLESIKIYNTNRVAMSALKKIDIIWSYETSQKVEFLKSSYWEEENLKEKSEKLKEFLYTKIVMVSIGEI